MHERSQSMEETADRIVRYLYDSFIDPSTGEKAFTLVRFFKTLPYGELSTKLQENVQSNLQGRFIPQSTKCLTLLATAGDESNWNFRERSTRHQIIPLIDRDYLSRTPMIFQLVQQFGLSVNALVGARPTLITDNSNKAFNIFYVPEALNSPYIPAQKEFVIPYEVESVLGFGSALPSGELFAVILFSKVFISHETADRFKWISTYVRIAVEPFDRGKIFTPRNPRMLSPVRASRRLAPNTQKEE